MQRIFFKENHRLRQLLPSAKNQVSTNVFWLGSVTNR